MTHQKRERSSSQCITLPPPNAKRVNLGHTECNNPIPKCIRPLIENYFANVMSLRHFLLSKLFSHSSKKRYRRLKKLTIQTSSTSGLVNLLDTTLVAFTNSPQVSHTWDHEFSSFVELYAKAIKLNSAQIVPYDYFRVLSFAIWYSLGRDDRGFSSSNLLTYGFKRSSRESTSLAVPHENLIVPGFVYKHFSQSLHYLCQPVWANLYYLLGYEATNILADLFLNTTIFGPLSPGSSIYRQLTGNQIFKLPALDSPPNENSLPLRSTVWRKSSEIWFARRRMLYSSPNLSQAGAIKFGLSSKHILNKVPFLCGSDDNESIGKILLQHIFPREYKFHSIFSSSRKNAMTTNMESISKSTNPNSIQIPIKIPKRLFSKAKILVMRFYKNHQKCSYYELLQYYCPAQKFNKALENSTVSHTEQNFHSFTTPPNQVYALLKAIVRRVIPLEFWGDQDDGTNLRHVLLWIKHFVHMRKNETITLHCLVERLKLSHMTWAGLGTFSVGSKMCYTDFNKRKQLVDEFIYFFFEWFILSLIKSHFYVTESAIHKNALVYFRHDVWRELTRPVLRELKLNQFERLTKRQAKRLLCQHTLKGICAVRLIPRNQGARPILNLAQRRKNLPNLSTPSLSINDQLKPISCILEYEKRRSSQNDIFYSMSSMEQICKRLIQFRQSLTNDIMGCKMNRRRLYFGKVDVESCFDSIPLQKLFETVNMLLRENEYTIANNVELRPISRRMRFTGSRNSERISYRKVFQYECLTKRMKETWGKSATMNTSYRQEEDSRTTMNPGAWKIKVQGKWMQVMARNNVIKILREHIMENIVRINGEYYRQKRGIAQGSTLSSQLCDILYMEFERQRLKFLEIPSQQSQCLLMRYVDDFLLISTKKDLVERFLQVMMKGDINYGIKVKINKTRTNYSSKVLKVIRNPSFSYFSNLRFFEYCGLMINTGNLDVYRHLFIHAKSSSYQDDVNALTVEYSRNPGRIMAHRMMNCFNLLLPRIFLCRRINNRLTILRNIFGTFIVMARRLYAYIKCIRQCQNLEKFWYLTKRIINEMIHRSIIMIISSHDIENSSSKSRCRYPSLDIRRKHIEWLAYTAFITCYDTLRIRGNWGKLIIELTRSDYMREAQTSAWMKLTACEKEMLKCHVACSV